MDFKKRIDEIKEIIIKEDHHVVFNNIIIFFKGLIDGK